MDDLHLEKLVELESLEEPAAVLGEDGERCLGVDDLWIRDSQSLAPVEDVT